MNDLGVLMILLAFANKNGFNSIKNAVKAADNFSSQINSISNIVNMLPALGNIFSEKSTKNDNGNQYIDTLKDMLSMLK